MIKINLLSPSDRLSAKWEKINCLIIFNFAIFIIAQLVLASIFLVSIKYLEAESKSLDERLENIQVRAEIKEIEEIKISVGRYDSQLGSILRLQEGRPAFTGTLENFSKIIPAGVKINSINIKPKGEEKENLNNEGKFDFNITGTVKSRENLLEFEDNLRDSEIFLDLITDLSNYDNENRNFKYRMTVGP